MRTMNAMVSPGVTEVTPDSEPLELKEGTGPGAKVLTFQDTRR